MCPGMECYVNIEGHFDNFDRLDAGVVGCAANVTTTAENRLVRAVLALGQQWLLNGRCIPH